MPRGRHPDFYKAVRKNLMADGSKEASECLTTIKKLNKARNVKGPAKRKELK